MKRVILDIGGAAVTQVVRREHIARAGAVAG
jgi:hypothetical protein